MQKIGNLSRNALRKMRVTERLKVMQNPNVGPVLAQILTPAQIAELFPFSYKRQIPDIGGFLRAIPSEVTRRRQEQLETQLFGKSSLTRDRETMEFADNLRRERRGGGTSVQQPTLTPEQQAAWNKLQSGAISADSAEAKVFATIPAEKLAALGIEKYTDDKGNNMLRYVAPTVTNEEAVNRLKSGSQTGGNLGQNQAIVYKTAISEGLSPAAARALSANLSGENLREPSKVYQDGKQVAHGIAAWETTRAQKIAAHFGKMPNEMSVADQTRAFLWEAKRDYKPTWNALNSGADERSILKVLVEDFERPQNPQKSYDQRIDFLSRLNTVGDSIKPLGPNNQYTEEQISEIKQQLIMEKSDQRRNQLAAILNGAGVNPIYYTGGGDIHKLPGKGVTEGVDRRLLEIIGAAGAHLEKEGYRVEIISGLDDRAAGTKQHPAGAAVDIQIYGPDGKIYHNKGDADSAIYQKFARIAYGEMLARHPDLKDDFRWGGAFDTKAGNGVRDTMHFDIFRRHIRGQPEGRYEQYRLSNLGPQPGYTYGTGRVPTEPEIVSVTKRPEVKAGPAENPSTGRYNKDNPHPNQKIQNITEQKPAEVTPGPAGSGRIQAPPSLETPKPKPPSTDISRLKASKAKQLPPTDAPTLEAPKANPPPSTDTPTLEASKPNPPPPPPPKVVAEQKVPPGKPPEKHVPTLPQHDNKEPTKKEPEAKDKTTPPTQNPTANIPTDVPAPPPSGSKAYSRTSFGGNVPPYPDNNTNLRT